MPVPTRNTIARRVQTALRATSQILGKVRYDRVAKTLPRDIAGRMAQIRLQAKNNRQIRRKHGCHQPLADLAFCRCEASRPQQSKMPIFLNNET